VEKRSEMTNYGWFKKKEKVDDLCHDMDWIGAESQKVKNDSLIFEPN